MDDIYCKYHKAITTMSFVKEVAGLLFSVQATKGENHVTLEKMHNDLLMVIRFLVEKYYMTMILIIIVI